MGKGDLLSRKVINGVKVYLLERDCRFRKPSLQFLVYWRRWHISHNLQAFADDFSMVN